MTSGTLDLPRAAMRGDKPAVMGVTDWLALGAAPMFAFMALFTGTLGAGAHAVCSAAGHAPALGGMVPMYVLMSAFHITPWLKGISRWRSADR